MDESRTTTWRFLFGFYPPEEAIGIAQSQGLDLSPPAIEQLRSRIAEARAWVSAQSRAPGGSSALSAVPAEFSSHLKTLESEPTFNECVQGMSSWSWKEVELAKLRTFQPSVNWEYVTRLGSSTPPAEDRAAVLKFCLPERGSLPPERMLAAFNPITNTYSVVTEHLDFRVVGQVQGEDANTKRKFLGFVLGFGLPTLTVAHYRDTYLLKNGYHRAVALLAKGHRKVPALVVEAGSLQQTGATAPGFFTVDILSAARPPLLSDFLSAAAVDLQRPKLRTVVSIHAEVQQLAI